MELLTFQCDRMVINNSWDAGMLDHGEVSPYKWAGHHWFYILSWLIYRVAVPDSGIAQVKFWSIVVIAYENSAVT